MTEIDDATGLPELPEEYFWRVSRTTGIFDIYPVVEIRQNYTGLFGREKSRQAGIGDTLKAHSYGPREGETVRENILWLTEILYERFKDQRVHQSEPSYIGDYPPKVFNAAAGE